MQMIFPNMWQPLSPTQCPSQVVATGQGWLHPSAISYLKASKATFLKASKAFGSFMAFLSYPSLHPFSSEVSWPCLSHAVNTNITWVKILKSCSQYKVSESISLYITFTNTSFKITSTQLLRGKKHFPQVDSLFFSCTTTTTQGWTFKALFRKLVVHTIATITLTPWYITKYLSRGWTSTLIGMLCNIRRFQNPVLAKKKRVWGRIDANFFFGRFDLQNAHCAKSPKQVTIYSQKLAFLPKKWSFTQIIFSKSDNLPIFWLIVLKLPNPDPDQFVLC